ncbi:TetR/AcrR family transcriptional regulator [Streptomyces mirabilis]|uniref:TetR/AcrR family transcriptional regulator n=1 Tax=Streptomyces mirabilis TaxID=68239 RepID=UPI00363DD422
MRSLGCQPNGGGQADPGAAAGDDGGPAYAAFGDKEDLFRKALDRYTEGPASYGARALQEPTARRVAAAFLNGSVRATTRPGCPTGCLGVQGALATGDPGSDARDALIAWRNEHTSRLRDRFRQAVDEGDLPPDADPELLARYLMTVANGIAVQAAGGTARDDLQQVADMALRSWPPA